MMIGRRVGIVYRKELIDILRDRRTLIAMIVVPIVLYPLLMLGSIQAVSYQALNLEKDAVSLAVVSLAHRDMLMRLIGVDAASLERERVVGPLEPLQDEWDAAQPRAITGPEPLLLDDVESMKAAIRARQVHAGVVFESDTLVDRPDAQNSLSIFADREDPRSAAAARRLTDMLERTRERTERKRLSDAGLPTVFAKPFSVRHTDLSSPPSILGQALPLILVLMTITGAIYPAIDLTAGERERNTLESIMVCPVPVIDLITGKFLVVTTIALMGAALNLASVSATVYFGGFEKVVSQTGGSMPIGTLLLVLLCLIPFAVLVSAIMIGVCSFARTFKEAQNYVTPVILAVLIPGGIAALPATRMEGVMLVAPVGNMVLLSRDLLMGASVPLGKIAMVLSSTALYAAAAVAVAANLFGKESVLFTDVGSLRMAFSRRFIKPQDSPTIPVTLLTTALLFPAWFFVQAAFADSTEQGAVLQLHATSVLMPLFFVLVPTLVMGWWKINPFAGTGCRAPSVAAVVSAILIGISAWVPLHELNVWLQTLAPIPAAMADDLKRLEDVIRSLSPMQGILMLAVIPALCEEFLFRGFLLRGLLTKARPRTAILATAVIFGVFHFVAFRFPTTFVMGLLLGWLAWRTRSLIPPMIVHLIHNGLTVSSAWWNWQSLLGIDEEQGLSHIPAPLIALSSAALLAGLVVAKSRHGERHDDRSTTLLSTSSMRPTAP